MKSGGHKSTTVVNERGKTIHYQIRLIDDYICEIIFRSNVISM